MATFGRGLKVAGGGAVVLRPVEPQCLAKCIVVARGRSVRSGGVGSQRQRIVFDLGKLHVQMLATVGADGCQPVLQLVVALVKRVPDRAALLGRGLVIG